MQQVVRSIHKAGKIAAWLMRYLDIARLLAVATLIIYLPALMVIALAVVLTSSGPAFIQRCYRRSNGQMVDLWEFRTECWQKWEPTLVGSCLRQSSLYRLPALVNVIKGEVDAGERVKAAS